MFDARKKEARVIVMETSVASKENLKISALLFSEAVKWSWKALSAGEKGN